MLCRKLLAVDNLSEHCTKEVNPLFEPELALLVGLQVVSSKEGGREGGRRKLFDKILLPGL